GGGRLDRRRLGLDRQSTVDDRSLAGVADEGASPRGRGAGPAAGGLDDLVGVSAGSTVRLVAHESPPSPVDVATRSAARSRAGADRGFRSSSVLVGCWAFLVRS